MGRKQDFSQSTIYHIRTIETKVVVYVGSSTNFKQRCASHKSRCKNSSTLTIYNYMRDNGGFDLFEIIPVIFLKLNDAVELRIEEQKEMDKYTDKLNVIKAYISDQDRIVRDKENGKKYYEENREKLIEKTREYYESNKDKVCNYQKEYYEQNREKVQEQKRQYREVNQEYIKHYHEEYRKANREKLREQKKSILKTTKIKSKKRINFIVKQIKKKSKKGNANIVKITMIK